jgi:hypothetical protein
MQKVLMTAFFAVMVATIVVMVRDLAAPAVTKNAEAQTQEAVITSVEIRQWSSIKDDASERRDSLLKDLSRKGCSTKECVIVVSGHGFDRWTTLRLNGQEGNLAVGGNVVVSYSDGGYNAGPEEEYVNSLSINPSKEVDKWGDRFLTLVIIDAYGHPMVTTGPAEQVIDTLFW